MSITLVDLAVGYRARRRTTTVASGLTATARRGELTVLLGPNGCGKSTLIRTLCGLQPALAGRVLLDDVALTELPGDERARRVGVVLTDRVDPGLLSARELAGLGRIPHLGLSGRLRPADDAVVTWALQAVGAASLADRPAAQLSDGERQRVLTARALAQQPRLLVLDEPTAFLDVPSRAGLVELLRGLAREQDLTVVLSTHDLELALRVADRVWLMHPGGRLIDAAPEELILDGRIAALFDGATLRFDPVSGTFLLRHADGGARTAHIEAPEPLGAALERVLAREGWVSVDGRPAEIVVSAADPTSITVHTGPGERLCGTVGELGARLRRLPRRDTRAVPAQQCAPVWPALARVSPYFALSTGEPDGDGWRPVAELYRDTTVLDPLIDGVGERIGPVPRRVAASTFHLGFAARLWSLWLGAAIGHGLVVDLTPELLHFRRDAGGIRLHLRAPRAWRTEHAGDAEAAAPASAAAVLDTHLRPLAAAVRASEPISERLLAGNTASALLGAARVLDAHRGEPAPGAAWRWARRVCEEQLTDTVVFTGTGYRRTSCCLFYRTPGGRLCGDCALDRVPTPRRPRRRDR